MNTEIRIGGKKVRQISIHLDGQGHFNIRRASGSSLESVEDWIKSMGGSPYTVYALINREKWNLGLSKEKAADLIKKWRKSCEKLGLTKLFKIDLK